MVSVNITSKMIYVSFILLVQMVKYVNMKQNQVNFAQTLKENKMKCQAFNNISALIVQLKNDYKCERYANIKAASIVYEEINAMIKDMNEKK